MNKFYLALALVFMTAAANMFAASTIRMYIDDNAKYCNPPQP